MIRVVILLVCFVAGYSMCNKNEVESSSELASNTPNSQFWSSSLDNVSLAAPLHDLMLTRDGIATPSALVLKNDKDEKYIDGELSFSSLSQNYRVNVQIYVRGQTSRDDCNFPKLKLKWKNAAVANTPLENLNGLKLNTHCSSPTETGYTEMGRVAGDRGPVREYIIYQIQKAFGLLQLENKLVKINYNDTSTKKSLTSYALFIEQNKDASRRFAGKLFEEEDLQMSDSLASDGYSWFISNQKSKIHDLILFQSFILNYDYGMRLPDLDGNEYIFSPAPDGFRNLIYLERPRQTESEVIATDYDVAGLVTQHAYKVPSETQKFLQCTSWICESQFTQLQKWKFHFHKTDWSQKIENWKKTIKPKISELLYTDTLLTSEEKKVFQTAMAAYDLQLAMLYKYPVVTKADQIFIYLKENSKQSCGHENPEERVDLHLPPGTPVQVLEKGPRRSFVKIFEIYAKTLTNPLTWEDCLNNNDNVWINNEDLQYIQVPQ